MNTAPVTESPAPPTEKAKLPRIAVTERVNAAHMPQVTRRFAKRLLERNLVVGDTFYMLLWNLRQMCHGATNMDVAKHLRRMRKAELIEYEINHQSGQVTLRFVV